MNKISLHYMDYVSGMDRKDFVIIDPPWNYNDRSRKSKASTPYTIWNNNIENLSWLFSHLDSRLLFIWTTNSMMEELMMGHNIHKNGYVYKTMVTWVKRTCTGKLFYGMGHSFRNCTEQLVMFSMKGEKPIRLKDRNLIDERAWPETKKPKIFEQSLVEKLKGIGYIKGSYIFSGLDVSAFEQYDVDCVDIRL
jgi:N6-adenosine-specific RNA methylase IME4